MRSSHWEVLPLCRDMQCASAFEWSLNVWCVCVKCVWLVCVWTWKLWPLCSLFSAAAWHAVHWPRNGQHSSDLQLWMNQQRAAIVEMKVERGGDLLNNDLMICLCVLCAFSFSADCVGTNVSSIGLYFIFVVLKIYIVYIWATMGHDWNIMDITIKHYTILICVWALLSYMHRPFYYPCHWPCLYFCHCVHSGFL